MTPSGPLNVSALTERDGSVMARTVPMLGWIRRLSQVAEYVVVQKLWRLILQVFAYSLVSKLATSAVAM